MTRACVPVSLFHCVSDSMVGWCVLAFLCSRFVLGAAIAAPPTHIEWENRIEHVEPELNGTELLKVFGVFRHGDRTPDHEELMVYPKRVMGEDALFPYGVKALTNGGKRRSYQIGLFLRRRYANFVSSLYLPQDLSLRCTDYDRTKMTALIVMAALYPPRREQMWNPSLHWQPVPYDLRPKESCDLLYWHNCPPYLKNKNKVYDVPEVAARIKMYTDLFDMLTNRTGYKYKSAEDVFYLDNLLQTQKNVGFPTPEWITDELMSRINEVTKLEFLVQYYNDKLISLSFGVMLGEIIKSAEQVVEGANTQPKLTLLAAHEENVAAMMSAVGVFYPHQPNYGATFLLELRRISETGKYAFNAVYSPRAGAPAHLLPISGCGGGPLCDFDAFVNLTRNIVLTREQYSDICAAES